MTGDSEVPYPKSNALKKCILVMEEGIFGRKRVIWIWKRNNYGSKFITKICN